MFRDFHAGLIADSMGDQATARTRLTAAYNGDKNTLRLVDAYGRFLSRHGDNAGATKVYEDFNQVLPSHPVIVAAMADLKAGKTLDPLVKSADQGAAEVLYGPRRRGRAPGRRDRRDDLPAALALPVRRRTGSPSSRWADIYDRLKQNEEAISLYESVPEPSPLRTTADIQIAQLLSNLGKTEESQKYLKQIVDEHPKDEDALMALGNAERDAKQFTEAAATYTKAIAASTKPEKVEWPLYYFRGISYERGKEWPKAVADFRKALVLYPDQPLVLNYLGYSWVDRGENLDEAFKMLHQAVEARPSDGYIVDSLGWGYYKLGKYDEATKELERAIDLKPGDPTINDHLGDAYWRIGRKLEAHFQWNHARDLGPDPDEKKQDPRQDRARPARREGAGRRRCRQGRFAHQGRFEGQAAGRRAEEGRRLAPARAPRVGRRRAPRRARSRQDQPDPARRRAARGRLPCAGKPGRRSPAAATR